MHAFLAAVRAAYGGGPALERVHAYRLEGSVFSAMRHEDAPTIRVWARPDRFKALVNYEEHPEARVVNGSDVWRNEPGGALEPATGPMRGAVLLQAARAGVPWTLLAHEADARLATGVPVPGEVSTRADGLPTRLDCLEIDLGGGLLLRAWADSLGRIVVSQGVLADRAMNTHFETVYSDFRKDDGVLFAWHEQNWASGMQTGATTVARIVTNPPLRADEFLPAAADSTRRTRDVR